MFIENVLEITSLANMIDPEKIRLYLSLFKDLKLSDLMQLISMAKTLHLAAGETYIKEGTLTSKLAYIKKGLIRGYTVKENGEEATILIRWEDQFAASHDNIILRRPSRLTYQAVEDTTLLELDYDAAQKIFDKNPRFAEARNFFILNMLADSLARVEAFILLTPEERYKRLLKDKPAVVERIPDKYIATMLGITPVSLSRIRKRIVKGKKH
ncbi:Crp/Fnr family transcriptional regulator [Mucilaginibacter hurinus]|uniref:Crp/Fnr family transcriptional regulator n=1 Tax=Mucilaginibacter hurinus TaxID=2201324 RepID=A0A367GQ69_9SPHI|nr:Crp/Fnr family transcriptional regulator [Mucilaginibacter hurinus]RCH55597.1 Crp/Fnr family transcriptional regulator [Mucilaginibacter hurinus]